MIKTMSSPAKKESKMFGVLDIFDGPVIPGLEKHETVYAKDQPQYRAFRTLPARNGDSAIGRFTFTDEQRKAIAGGADIYLEILHFGRPLAPSLLMVMSEPDDSAIFQMWWKHQTQGPYEVKINE
jgi:hypothetical protein